MSDFIYNRYQGRWAGGSMCVDAPDLRTAVLIMTQKRGSEPIHVSLLESNVYVAATQPTATFVTSVICDDVVDPNAGDVFPASATLPIGNTTYVNAVAKDGYEFKHFASNKGLIVSTSSEYKFTLSEDVELRAVFEKLPYNPADVSIEPTLSKLLRVNRDDGNYAKSQANQDAVTLATTYDESTNTITATFVGTLSTLQEFASTAGMGTAKWIALAIDTNEDYTKDAIFYNGMQLPASEFTDANHLGLIGNGAFIVWMKAEEIAAAPKRINVYTSNKQKRVYINCNFTENQP